MKIAIIEECGTYGERLKVVLENDRHEVILYKIETKELEKMSMTNIDLVIIDLGLGCKEKLKIIKSYSEKFESPIIFAIAAQKNEILTADVFQNGVYDIIQNPFDLIELSMRISSLEKILKNIGRENTDSQKKQNYKSIEFNSNEVVFFDKSIKRVKITKTESALLKYFANNAGKILTREQILLNVWKDKYYEVTDRSVDTCIYRMRLKIKAFGERIETVSGFGYRLNV